MITSTIKFSQIEDRIDAEYYKPEYLEVERFFSRSKNIFTIGKIIKSIQHPREFKREYSMVGGIPYLRVSNVKDGYIDLSDIEYVYADRNIGLNKINTGNILITRSGTVGIPVLVTPEFDGMLISADFLKLVLREKINNLEINPHFVYIFLSSKLGLSQSQRKLIGALQKHINTEGLSSIKIPIPSQSLQQKIEKIVKEAQEKRRLADEKYKEAEEILNKELGLEKLDLSTQKTFETKFSETNERIDPEYYQPIFNEIEKVFNKQKTVNLGDISLEIKYGTSEDLFYVEKGAPFLRVTDINKFSTIEPMEGKFINNFDAERLKEYQVKTDDVIISRTGTLGLAVYIDEKLDGTVYGSYFIKVKPRHKDLYNRFIAFFISSKIGRLQTNRWASGGIQTNLTIDAIKSIRIPILSRPIQQRICSLIQDSLRLRKETENLLNEAKQKVEKMVLGE